MLAKHNLKVLLKPQVIFQRFMKEVVEQRLIVGNRRICDELYKLWVMRFVNDDRVSYFNCWKVFFILLEEAVHVFFVGLSYLLGIVASINLLDNRFDAFDVLKELVVLLAAQQIFTVLQSRDVTVGTEVQGFNKFFLALKEIVVNFVRTLRVNRASDRCCWLK